MARNARASTIAALGLAALALAGCSAAATSAPTQAPTAAPTQAPPAATAAPATPPATQAASATDVCTVAEASGGEPIAAATYRFSGQGRPFTFTLPAGYGVSCSGSVLGLFGPEGSIAIVDGVAQVGSADGVAAVGPDVEAVRAAVAKVATSVDGERLGTIGDIEGQRLTATLGDGGIVVKGADGRGWALSKEEAATVGITIVKLPSGEVVMALRSGTDPVMLGEDVMNSIMFE